MKALRLASLLLTLSLVLGSCTSPLQQPPPSAVSAQAAEENSPTAVSPPPAESSVPPQAESSQPEPEIPESPQEVPAPSQPESPLTIVPSPQVWAYTFDSKGLLCYNLFSTDPKPEDTSDYAQMVRTLVEVVNSAEPVPAAAAESKVEGGFLLVSQDGSYAKTEYRLRPTVLEVNGTAYALTQEQYDTLLGICKWGKEQRVQWPYWLIYMNPNRVVKVECTDETGQMRQMIDDNIYFVAEELHTLSAEKGSLYAPGTVDFSNMFRAVFTFDNEGTYTIAIDDKTMYLEATGMDYACKYTTSTFGIPNFAQDMPQWIEGPLPAPEPDAPLMGKPVIYLYPERTQNVTVQLDFQGTLGYTWPVYENGGWEVTASPDGSLVNQGDGSAHRYLFWDGWPDQTDWDLSRGFVVRGRDSHAFLLEKLPLLGLEPVEYNDFLTYWVPQLSRNPWNLITFLPGEEYEKIAPLAVSPAPDTVIRISMVWKPLEAPLALPEPALPAPPVRKGFILVEWGGVELGIVSPDSTIHAIAAQGLS